MLFGQSIFQSVVSRLEAENAQDEVADGPQSFRVRGLSSGFVASTSNTATDIGAGTDAYFTALADLADMPEMAEPLIFDETAPASAEDDTPDTMPVHFTRLSEPEIAEDLGLSPEDDEASLNERRRRFAKENHPDRVAPQWREPATIRMKIANLLTDTAIRDRQLRTGTFNTGQPPTGQHNAGASKAGPRRR